METNGLGNKVPEFRELKNLTQSDLAELTGVSRQTIHAVETGAFVPSITLSLKITKIFNVEFKDVFYLKKGNN